MKYDLVRTISKMMAAAATCLAVVVIVGLFVMSPNDLFSGGPARPTGFPADAERLYNHLDGSTWYYCRNTPSGAVWVERYRVSSDPFFRFQAGGKCGRTPLPELLPSAEVPAFIVNVPGYVRLVVRAEQQGPTFGECLFRPSPAYITGARRQIAETMAVDDTPIRKAQPSLKIASQRLADLPSTTLKNGGSDASEAYCSMDGTRR